MKHRCAQCQTRRRAKELTRDDGHWICIYRIRCYLTAASP